MIWSHPYLNEKRLWGPHNTILVDNDAQKILPHNPEANVLVVPEFKPEDYTSGSYGVEAWLTSIYAKIEGLPSR
jgi:hypothetical protein